MRLWKPLLALALLGGLVAVAVGDWSRVQPDFWPPDRSFVGPNLVAAVVQGIVVLAVVALLYPPIRAALDRYVRRHVDELKAHVETLHQDTRAHAEELHAAVHARLDAIEGKKPRKVDKGT